jgi:hypothetical protein
MPDLPIVCTLTPEALEVWREGLLVGLLRRSAGHELLPDGIRIRFAPSSETLARIARAVDAERHCCRFLRFTVPRVDRAGRATCSRRRRHTASGFSRFAQTRNVGSGLACGSAWNAEAQLMDSPYAPPR